MTNFKPEWANGIDGAKFVAVRVPQIQVKLYSDDTLDDIVGVGGCIDHTLAIVCQESFNGVDVIDKLTYIISQLSLVRANIKEEIA